MRDVGVEEIFNRIAGYIALGVEGSGALVIAYGALEALFRSGKIVIGRLDLPGERRQVWLRFAGWLLLGLEFELAADIVRTAIAPTWASLGQLATIAAIRTALNFFLEKDLERGQPEQRGKAPSER